MRSRQLALPFAPTREFHLKDGEIPARTALEDESFPFEALSDVAEHESWRKELHRPIYHVHKWWARRLGSIFRAIIIALLCPKGSNVLQLFYEHVRFHGATVLDPFMGSGTTIGEAVKLNCHAIGRDINPVAYFLVKNALSVQNRATLLREFGKLETELSDTIKKFYKSTLSSGQQADVLYYFWVAYIQCPTCGCFVDLFPKYIFAQHANKKRHPVVHIVCPQCGNIDRSHYSSTSHECSFCLNQFNPQKGSVSGRIAKCDSCNSRFSVSEAVKSTLEHPRHRLYAKLVLLPDGSKTYLSISKEDLSLFNEARIQLQKLPWRFPSVRIAAGDNTNQVLRHNYRFWHEMFNDRQLLCLSLLAHRISEIHDERTRELFTCLFSGVLEFNNMFASYKGEGTGAVRHMFHHHVLKPERMPIEANVWGTEKSSGSFLTMFKGRILKALDYLENPFELALVRHNDKVRSHKIYGISEPLEFTIASTFKEFSGKHRVYLSCGDSSTTDIPSKSVAAVITDPPFFDNVNYSELADFFYIWQRQILEGQASGRSFTTRSPSEVQHSNPVEFSRRLTKVWREVHRILKDGGALVFTYHHSRSEGWSSVLESLLNAGFVVTATQPVVAEMSGAIPKRRAKHPISLDIIVVCRKKDEGAASEDSRLNWSSVREDATRQVHRFWSAKRGLGRNDLRVIVMGQFVRHLSHLSSSGQATAVFGKYDNEIEALIDSLHTHQRRNSMRM